MTALGADQRPVYTLTSRPAVLTSYEEAIAQARALKPVLRERVAEAEKLRRLPRHDHFFQPDGGFLAGNKRGQFELSI